MGKRNGTRMRKEKRNSLWDGEEKRKEKKGSLRERGRGKIKKEG